MRSTTSDYEAHTVLVLGHAGSVARPHGQPQLVDRKVLGELLVVEVSTRVSLVEEVVLRTHVDYCTRTVL